MSDFIKKVFNPADGFLYTLKLKHEDWKAYREMKMKSLSYKLKNGMVKYLTDLDYSWLEVEIEKISVSIDDIITEGNEIFSNN
jgi:hypothetical protein